jgi:flagellar hook-associated protein 2
MATGTISSAGVGSGLDVNGIVTQLMAIERAPITRLDASKTKLNTQLSSFGKIQSSLSALRDAARSLTDKTAWTPTTVKSTDEAAVSAVSNGSSPPGNYAVNVTQLAAAQSVTSKTYPTPQTVVGTGTLSIELGQWFTDPPDFTPKTGTSAVSITIGAGDDTLEKIRDKINDAGAGVSASIVNDATGARLAIRSTETGQTQGFRIASADAGLSDLAYDATGGSQMTLAQSAANAQLTINNIPVNSTTNTLTDVLDGLTVNVSRVTADPVSLSVNTDTETIKKSITDFATAYNDVVKLVREQTAYNGSSAAAGALQGDRTAVGLLGKLRNLVAGNSGATTAFTRMSQIGLEPQTDGSLKVSDSKLTSALGRLKDLKDFFSRDDVGEANDGFATALRQYADLAVGSEGVITSRQSGLKDRMDALDKRKASMEDRLVTVESRMRAQYTKLDATMGQLSGLQAYMNQQVALWNKSSNN